MFSCTPDHAIAVYPCSCTLQRNRRTPETPCSKGSGGLCTLAIRFEEPTSPGEHFVHIEGVVGSSPTVTTQKSGRRYESTLAGFFCVPFCVPLRVRTRGTQRVRKNRCVPVRKWGTQMPKKCVPSAGYSFTSTVPGQSSFEFGQKSAYAPPPIKSARFLDQPFSRGSRANVGRNMGKRFLLCLKGDAYACAYYQFCRLNYRSGIISFLHNIVHSSSVYISDVVLVAVNAALGNILNPGDFQS